MNLIVAMTKNYAIGNKNELLFHLPTDLKNFKEKTTNKVVVMGLNTYLSLPKRPLPNRVNIVITRKNNIVLEGTTIVHSIQELFEILKTYNSNNVFVIGGAKIYNQLMDYCKYAYVTYIETEVPADTYIKNIENVGFKLKESSQIMHENDVNYTFRTYENTKPKNI